MNKDGWTGQFTWPFLVLNLRICSAGGGGGRYIFAKIPHHPVIGHVPDKSQEWPPHIF